VLLMTEMPPDPIVPALVTPPLKVVWLISIAGVLPLNLVGYGPVNGICSPAISRRPVFGCSADTATEGASKHQLGQSLPPCPIEFS
jgi:hypothetical protein